jgi:hypothetical protein
MASVQVYDTVKNLLVAAHAPIPVIDYDVIDNRLEQTPARFLCIEEVFSDEEVTGIGDPQSVCVTELSSLTVFCYVPAPESSNAARRLAEQVQDSLRLQDVNHVRVLDVTPPQLLGANDGLWTAYYVTVEIEMDRHVALP